MHFTGAVRQADFGDDPELVDRKVAPALEVVIGIDNIMFSHGRHMFHVVSNPSLIFDKSSSSLGLDHWIRL